MEGQANNWLLVSGASDDLIGRDAGQTKSSAIEFAQALGFGDRNAALQRRRALRMARRQNTAKQNEEGDGKSHPRLISHFGKIAEKRTECLAAIGRQQAIASRRSEAMRPLV